MKKIFFLFFAFTIFTSFTSADHEFYLSVTEIEYDKEDRALQIVSRVFIDDMEDVLSKRYQKEISLSYEKDLESNKDLMARYIDQKLKISVNGKPATLNLLGSKFDADQVVLFIEVEKVEDFKKIRVENLILTDLFDSQKNVVHVKKGETIESMLLVKGNGNKTVTF
ncbi:hypothetical protein MKO06_16090 [Gramella sp. GC03-9]|uniref:Peptidase E n=1 Tax=Christiangramia oceanisediminis TaxID=2920386 RepID=A0A9X2L053_9FLAO|nr:DUF6702 family protein [Gramella oceanisediminis]MCP9201432.1 hypothetical protein [Gramella oceanisediminis]